MNNNYTFEYKLNTILTNKFLGVLVAVLIPTLSLFGAVYFANGNTVDLHAFSFLKPKALVTTEVKTVTKHIESPFAKMLAPLYTDAVRVQFPTQNADLSLVSVGVATDGTLETPHEWLIGGWYNKGARPGELGNMIINAHYDDNMGRPAGFWSLKNLKIDDKVVVQDSYGKSYEYKITATKYVGINDPERTLVFEDPKDNKAIVTLITCGGVWLPGQATYNKRLVVVGELIR